MKIKINRLEDSDNMKYNKKEIIGNIAEKIVLDNYNTKNKKKYYQAIEFINKLPDQDIIFEIWESLHANVERIVFEIWNSIKKSRLKMDVHSIGTAEKVPKKFWRKWDGRWGCPAMTRKGVTIGYVTFMPIDDIEWEECLDTFESIQ